MILQSLILFLGSICADTLPVPHHMMWYTPESAIMVYVESIAEIAPYKYSYKGSVRTMTYPEALQLIASRWVSPKGLTFNYHNFRFLSQHWPGHEAKVVTEPVKFVTYFYSAVSSKVYHLPSCRYVSDTMIKIYEPGELVPCKVCGPDKIENLIKEFLPKGE